MREKLRFLGLDVHAETIAVAVAEADGKVRSLGTIATIRPEQYAQNALNERIGLKYSIEPPAQNS
jgi:hypothetical protein